jgi:hypothetical protein
MFFFRKKSIVVDCFTAISGAMEYAKPKNAAEFIPQWWKDLPKTYVDDNSFYPNATMRSCSGFIDLYKRGIIMPAWCDISVEIGKKGTYGYRWQFSDDHYNAAFHDARQIDKNFNSEEYAHIKLMSPWAFRTTDKTYFSFQAPAWNMLYNFNYKILNGVLEFKNQPSTHVNMLFKRKNENYIENIKYKTPLAHLVPLSDKKIKLKHHLVSKSEFNSFDNPRIKFIQNYNEIKKSNCPFSKSKKKISG